MENSKKHLIVTLLIAILVISNAFFIYKYISAYDQIREVEKGKEKAEFNQKVIGFTSTFIRRVLQADKEVDFETRLSLENAVRDLKDEEIMAEWQKFVGSKTEAEAQESVKKLLEILITKIQE